MNHLTIGTVVCDQEAFRAFDLLPLMGRSQRGNNRVMPGAVGQRALAGVLDQIDEPITWYVDGRKDWGGTVHSSGGYGRVANLDYYRAAFFDQANATTGLTAATITLPTGTVTANIQCWDWDQRFTGPSSAEVVTRLVVPAGDWT